MWLGANVVTMRALLSLAPLDHRPSTPLNSAGAPQGSLNDRGNYEIAVEQSHGHGDETINIEAPGVHKEPEGCCGGGCR